MDTKPKYFFRSSNRNYILFVHLFHQNNSKIHWELGLNGCVCLLSAAVASIIITFTSVCMCLCVCVFVSYVLCFPDSGQGHHLTSTVNIWTVCRFILMWSGIYIATHKFRIVWQFIYKKYQFNIRIKQTDIYPKIFIFNNTFTNKTQLTKPMNAPNTATNSMQHYQLDSVKNLMCTMLLNVICDGVYFGKIIDRTM